MLSPPEVGKAEILSGHACRDMLTSRTFVDLTYHRQFNIKVPEGDGESLHCERDLASIGPGHFLLWLGAGHTVKNEGSPPNTFF